MIELLKSYGGLSYVSSMLSIVLFNVQLCILILILKMLTFAAFFLIFIIMLSCVGRFFFSLFTNWKYTMHLQNFFFLHLFMRLYSYRIIYTLNSVTA